MITNLENSEELANILNERIKNRSGGSNQRLAIMLGWYRNDKENPIKIPKENIPKDRSQFSQEKYKFFLEAPFEISNKCCSVLKKNPAHEYNHRTGRHPITAQMASESRLRTQKWIENGCNGFNLNEPISNPMSFWTEQDVLLYLALYGDEITNDQSRLEYLGIMHYGDRLVVKETGATYENKELRSICSVYGDIVIDYDKENNVSGQMDFSQLSSEYGLFDIGNRQLKTTGCSRTGCVTCGFGCQIDTERFANLRETHPHMYKLLDKCKNNGITYREAIDWINEHGNLGIKY